MLDLKALCMSGENDDSKSGKPPKNEAKSPTGKSDPVEEVIKRTVAAIGPLGFGGFMVTIAHIHIFYLYSTLKGILHWCSI